LRTKAGEQRRRSYQLASSALCRTADDWCEQAFSNPIANEAVRPGLPTQWGYHANYPKGRGSS
jgi:hypothetical protein